MRFFRLAIFLLLATLLLPMAGKSQGGQSYTTITSLTFSPLSNGVQIKVKADGILQMRIVGNDNGGTVYGARMEFSFPDARNGIGKNFFTSKLYPISYAQLSTAPGAKNGIGLSLVVSNLINTQASVTKMDDGEGVLITVQSDRTVERSGRVKGGAAEDGGAQSGATDTSTRVRFKNGKLTLRAVGADIHQFMSAIAQTTGFSIAVDDAVDRKVSINLQDIDPTAALQTIATAYGLAISRIGGIYMMSEGVPTDLATYHLSGTQSYRMQNTQAGIASGLLPNFLYSYAHVNSEQNAVVVTAPSQMLAKIGADLNKVDIPSPEISIEAIAVEFTDTKNLNVGLNLTNQQSAIFDSIDVPNGVITYNTFGKLPVDFEASLSALELKGKARVRARPRMAAVNGRTANIFIGAQRFILTQFNQSGQTQTRIQPVDVGVKLSVTPLTGGNGEITIHVAPEVSNITELDLQTGLPVLSTRRADTTVRVKDGETIAIGGLSLDQEQTTRTKIPLLGDLPLIGNLFRSKNDSQVKTELVVFVTPHILTAADLSTAPPAPKGK
ncbi:hypothetical protein CCAX7_24440 [Capsulimonas corticalis]|uniref:Uncharacterized protein n=1 Tax=Capsulimonas corticalis TaxID=2219043 RepID=A0A402CVG7_9BACT|nr:type II and III secretion system protein [Capsulimonas corticalis]BDI30393.1 hypothetical protein CCAX7_24440 [Capsulimonas corticalis]